MHYYIDGYNLLFRILKAGDDVRKQRTKITLEIERKVHLLGLDVTLVFDSHYQESESTRSHFNSLEIVFTATGETADEFILQELKDSPHPSQHTVVTSDKKLARLCQLRLGKTESIDEFLAWISKRYKNKLRQKKLLTIKPQSQKIPEHPLLTSSSSSTRQEDPQNCFDYYLEIFEKKIEEFEKNTPRPKKIVVYKSKKTQVKKRKLTQEEALLSDLQRWQQAFEKNLREDDDNFVY